MSTEVIGRRQHQAVREELRGASLLEQDLIDQKAREIVLQIVGTVLAGFADLKREIRKNETSLQTALGQVVNGAGT